jgi:hypothetical protein
MKNRLASFESISFIVAFVIAATAAHRIHSGVWNFTTGVLFWIAASAFAFIATGLLLRALGRSEAARLNARMLFSTLCILLIAVEAFLRFGLGRYATYMEKTGLENGQYVSPYDATLPTWFHTRPAGRELTVVASEFWHSRKINSLGLAEREVELDKPPGEYRIIAIGDSYTEGVGTTYDTSWVRIAERNLQVSSPDKDIIAINAGIAGSDPLFEYMLLKGKLLSLDPDLVIFAMNDSDVFDVMKRGGMERFRADGSTQSSASPPSWEWLYAISFITRHIVHGPLQYNWQFCRPDNCEEMNQGAVNLIMQAVDSVSDLSRVHGFDVVFVTHPVRWEVLQEYWGDAMKILVEPLSKRTDLMHLDLLENWASTGAMTPENAKDHYWEVDGHHNELGYRVMGESIAEGIQGFRLIEE